MITLKLFSKTGHQIEFGTYTNLDTATEVATKLKHEGQIGITIVHKPSISECILSNLPYPSEIIYKP